MSLEHVDLNYICSRSKKIMRKMLHFIFYFESLILKRRFFFER